MILLPTAVPGGVVGYTSRFGRRSLVGLGLMAFAQGRQDRVGAPWLMQAGRITLEVADRLELGPGLPTDSLAAESPPHGHQALILHRVADDDLLVLAHGP